MSDLTRPALDEIDEIDQLRAKLASARKTIEAMGVRARQLEAELARKGALIGEFGQALTIPGTTAAERALIDAALAWCRIRHGGCTELVPDGYDTPEGGKTMRDLFGTADAVRLERGEA